MFEVIPNQAKLYFMTFLDVNFVTVDDDSMLGQS